MLGFLQSPTTETIILVYVAFQLYSAAVQSLPSPTEFGGVWYKAFYNFLSIIGADFKSFVTKNPSFSALTTSTSTSSPSGIVTVDKSTIINSTETNNQSAIPSPLPSYTGGNYIRQNESK